MYKYRMRDLFSRTRAAKMLSTLMIIMAIAPIAGIAITIRLSLRTEA